MVTIVPANGLTIAAVKQLFGGVQRKPDLVGTAKVPGLDPMDATAKQAKAMPLQPAPHTTAARVRDDGSASATDHAVRTGETLGLMTHLVESAMKTLDIMAANEDLAPTAGNSPEFTSDASVKAKQDERKMAEEFARIILDTALGHLEGMLGKPAQIETSAEGYRRIAAFEVTREFKDGPARNDGVSMTFTGGGGRESRYSITDNRSGSTWTYRYEPRFDESQQPRGVLINASA
ncbi:hypothetical protein [Caenispirillum bisanense]|uniref:hypothetical protein n=1 Tax=Caenispirillum bisanense TaxID=414052 RepID=UPI0031E250CE